MFDGRLEEGKKEWWLGHESRGGGGTVDPADGHRLEDGEEQQAGSTAREVVVDLENVEAALQRPAEASATAASNGTERKSEFGEWSRADSPA